MTPEEPCPPLPESPAEAALRRAFEALSLPMLERALSMGASLEQTMAALPSDPLSISRPILWQAIYRAEPESVAFVEALLKAGASVRVKKGAFVISALHHCCDGPPHAEAKLRLCLSFGESPDARDLYERSPAHIVCWNHDHQELAPNLLRILAEAGADLGALDNRQCSPLDLAIENANWPALQTLLEMGQRADLQKWARLHGLGKGAAARWPTAKAMIGAFEEREAIERVASPSPPLARAGAKSL